MGSEGEEELSKDLFGSICRVSGTPKKGVLTFPWALYRLAGTPSFPLRRCPLNVTLRETRRQIHLPGGRFVYVQRGYQLRPAHTEGSVKRFS